ncbi:MAG TPA: hypothetical protein VIH47_09520 [Solirubrobacterales bacterium]
MRRAGLVLASLLVAAIGGAPVAAAQEWRSEQPVAAGIGVPVGIGEIGDVEFWAPNRGMLITAGNEGIPAGLFAYDGSGWYRYSTVCGGHAGRIAWAGPDDFWTISDQQTGQEGGKAPPQHISLCHFLNGAVVSSYAEPLGVADSYLPMDAAACSAPNDCWFAGERLPGTTNIGAFHLHWDGASITAVPSLTEQQAGIEDPGRSVTSLAFHQGSLYESVEVGEGDVAPEEPVAQPSFLHQIFEAATPAFIPLYTEEPILYGGAHSKPAQLEGFHLSGDDQALWAIAGSRTAPATVTALRLGPTGFAQVALDDPGGTFEPGDRVGGVAAEPGSEDVWIGFNQPGDFSSSPARLARVHGDGSVDSPTLLPAPGEGIGHKGPAGPIACPAAGQCWMATEGGWLFHLGSDLPRDADPALHTLVTFRPPDASLPTVPPVDLPEDNSGANPEEKKEPLPEVIEEPLPKRVPALYAKVKSRLLDGNVLELTFLLRTKAHVQLLARFEGKVVAKTPRYTMKKGTRSLRLRLDPKRWPTKLDLQVHAVGKRKAK